ncbi:MAG: NYN domain-containing protein [Kineosporiaceae bacterium]|nr:NYN domain-containing protein [Kineosporiaceae bacterium]MBK8077106.1 NYN domain-containing protein [Kineosporiaceae bacterium]
MTDPELPDAVQRRMLVLAARVLGELEPDRVPVVLRRVRAFAPARRAVAGAGALRTALDAEVVFRQAVAAAWRGERPEVAALVVRGGLAEATSEGGEIEDAVLPELLVGLFLVRPEGWEALAGEVRERLDARHRTRSHEAVAAAAERETALARAERDRVQRELDAVTAAVAEREQELAVVRRELRRARSDADRARAQVRAVEAAQADQAQQDQERLHQLAAEVTRLGEELAAAQERGEAARQSARADRALDDARVRLLLDAVIEAAGGLRRELALPPVGVRPADVVAEQLAARTAPGGERTTSGGSDDLVRGRSQTDPGLLADLLTVPQTHLVIDGYNVTKTGYPALALTEQRRRLLDGLAALAARTGVEITCCFDGSDAVPAGPPPPVRGVRVLFSVPPMNADELIRRLVRSEPVGRPVVVVSTDGEVVSGVSRSGARAVASLALVRLLGSR